MSVFSIITIFICNDVRAKLDFNACHHLNINVKNIINFNIYTQYIKENILSD